MTTRRVGVIVLLLTCALDAKGSDKTPQFKSATQPAWNEKFNTIEGWIGGDAIYSVAIDDHRVIWFFGDSFWGKVVDGKPAGAQFINNAIAISSGKTSDAPIRFFCGTEKEGKVGAFFAPPDGKGWMWPQAPIVVDGKLYLFVAQMDKMGQGGPFGFKQIAQWLAIIRNPGDEPSAWKVEYRLVPFAIFAPERTWSLGSSALLDDGFVYIYGYEQQHKNKGRKHLIVARADARKLDDFSTWAFRTENDWSPNSESSALLADELATEFSVTKSPGIEGFVLIYTENGLGERIVARSAPKPFGPWSNASLIYPAPVMAADRGLFTYSAKAHTWATDDGMLISYCVNAWDFGRVLRDSSVYRPKFIRVSLK